MADPKAEKFYSDLLELIKNEGIEPLSDIIEQRKKKYFKNEIETIDFVIRSACNHYCVSEHELKYGKGRKTGKRWSCLMCISTILSQLLGCTYKEIGEHLNKSHGAITNYMVSSNRILIDATNGVVLTAEQKEYFYSLKELYSQANEFRTNK